MKTRPRKHAPPEVRRAEILSAALRCFADRGYHATTMDDLVRESGLSKGSLYWHFVSKEDVFVGVFDLMMERVATGLDDIERSGDRVPDVLRAQCEFLVAVLCEERMHLQAWIEFLSHPEGRRRMAETYRWSRARLADEIARGVELGQIRPGVADGLPSALTALVEGMLLQAMMDPEFDASRALAGSWELVARGMEVG